MNFTYSAILVFCLALSSCHSGTSSSELQRKTLYLQYIRTSIKPGDDFYQFANGKWLDTVNISSSEDGAGIWWEIEDKIKLQARRILESAANSTSAKGTIVQQVGDFYVAGMDTLGIEQGGIQPVMPYLNSIDSIRDLRDIMKYDAGQCRIGFPILLYQFIDADEKNSSRNIVKYWQFGLGLPDRDYYFKTDPATLAIVEAYKRYLATLFMLAGDSGSAIAQNVNKVYGLERKMAASHKTIVEAIDPKNIYHKMAVSDAQKAMPAIGWIKLTRDLGINTDTVDICQVEYYSALNNLLGSVPITDWKIYLRAHTLDNTATFLSHDFQAASFAYHGRALVGLQQVKPRWQRIYQIIYNNLGEALGQLYVQQYFPAESKQRITELVNNLQKAFANRIDHLDWMSDTTKIRAKEKLFGMMKKVAYPDKWRDYTNVVIQKDAFFGDVVSSGRNEYAYQTAKLGKPVDRTEWIFNPLVDNGRYDPNRNTIEFPAGGLAFPIFDPLFDDALNYGGIGMVIGHEMTHGFDNRGSQYDKNGNLSNWWTKTDYDHFRAKCEHLIKLYSGFTVLDSLHLNGQLTESENIADLGALAIAYDAFKLTPEGRDTTRIDGFTPDQRFFLSFAQTWRVKRTPDDQRTRVNNDLHSPPKFRVWGATMNHPAFYKAFNVQPGDAMYLPDTARVKIW
jgi:putative endopeptidase